PTIPTPTSRSIKNETRLARVRPCRATAKTVRKPNVAANRTTMASTRVRLTRAGGSAGPSRRGGTGAARPCGGRRTRGSGPGRPAAPGHGRGEPRGAEVQLLEEPEPEQEHGRDLDDRREEDDEHQREYPRAGVEQDVAAEHAGDGARRAERRRRRVGIDDDLG